MGIYSRHVLPWVLDRTMAQAQLRAYRNRVVGAARGRVLEVGAGSGRNFAHYGAGVGELLALEPAPEMTAKARRAAAAAGRAVTFLEASGEAIPLDDRSVDAVVTTWTLCSIPDALGALAEARRVLRPGGELLFVEHGLAPEARVRRWQRRLTPLWKRCGGGCHLDRAIDALVREAGFTLDDVRTGYAKGPRFATFMYEGRARP